MATSVNFSGSLQLNTSGCGCAVDDEVELAFDGGAKTYGAVFQSTSQFQFADSPSWQQLPLADDLVTVSLLYLAAKNGTATNLLIGTPPVWQGSGGTFPTGFVGGEIFSFQILTYNPATGGYVVDATITVTFTVAAQTAEDCARAINAQLALVGYAAMASVVSGQIVLRGQQPGQNTRLANSTANTTIGFAAGNLGANGTGVSQNVPGMYLAEFAAVPAVNFWLKGSAWLELLVAGVPL
jgi:hypothetical protein